MQQVYLKLDQGNIEIINKTPIYLQPSENLTFIITNITNLNDKLYYNINGIVQPIINKEFMLNYNEFKNGLIIKVLLKPEGAVRFIKYVSQPLKVCQLKVLGDTIEDNYPEVIREINIIKDDIENIKIRLTTLEEEGHLV